MRAALLAMLLLAPVIAAATAPQLGVPATIGPAGTPVRSLSYPVFDASWGKTGTKSWLVTSHTGNCCENALTVTQDGRIFDFGGGAPIFSTDGGHRWSIVNGLPTVTAEGSLAVAPNGDLVGATYDIYSVDRVVTFKFVAAENKWYSGSDIVHTPVYDRPWVQVIPGPFVVGGQRYEYVSRITGGGPQAAFFSLDGLNYAIPSIEGTGQGVSLAPIEPGPNSILDGMQPDSRGYVTLLPGGGALMTLPLDCDWGALTQPDLSFVCVEPFAGSGLRVGERIRIDGAGHMWAVRPAAYYPNGELSGLKNVTLLRSLDGGRTWDTLSFGLPPWQTTDGHAPMASEMAVSSKLDEVAISVKTTDSSGNLHILVFKINAASTSAPSVTRYEVGAGDHAFASSAGVGTDDRMDFVSMGLMPDGRVVTSFADGAHMAPAIAVEQP